MIVSRHRSPAHRALEFRRDVEVLVVLAPSATEHSTPAEDARQLGYLLVCAARHTLQNLDRAGPLPWSEPANATYGRHRMTTGHPSR